MKEKRKPKKAARVQPPAAGEQAKAHAQAAWPDYTRKLEQLTHKNIETLIDRWLGHMPSIRPEGAAPQICFDDLEQVKTILGEVKITGSAIVCIKGIRSIILHEAIYQLHKAVHAEIACANNLRIGRHSWAICDAYQASLFALGAILGFFGIAIARDKGNFILVDVWPDANKGSRSQGLGDDEACQLIRFKQLDHYHKWAILQRLFRTLEDKSILTQHLRTGLDSKKDSEFAIHRNSIHYKTTGWLSSDLIEDDLDGPVRPIPSVQDFSDHVVKGTPESTVYLMGALIEFGYMLLERLGARSGVISDELAVLNRRTEAVSTFSTFDWADAYVGVAQGGSIQGTGTGVAGAKCRALA